MEELTPYQHHKLISRVNGELYKQKLPIMPIVEVRIIGESSFNEQYYDKDLNAATDFLLELTISHRGKTYRIFYNDHEDTPQLYNVSSYIEEITK